MLAHVGYPEKQARWPRFVTPNHLTSPTRTDSLLAV